VVPSTGAHVNKALALFDPLFQSYRFDFYVALLMPNPRSIIVLMGVFYDKASDDETSRARALYETLSSVASDEGYQQYRTGTAGMNHLFEAAPAFAALCGALKHALDPAGILAPGKLPAR
jgi:4-cresol dehydrogenase (hydroxylating)